MMVYKTIANEYDNIRLSFLWDEESGTYEMPSLEMNVLGRSLFYADNHLWITNTLLPALIRFEKRSIIDGDMEIVDGITRHFIDVTERDEAVSNTIEIIEYAIKNNLFQP